MHGHRHVGGCIRRRLVDQIAINSAEIIRVVAAVRHLLPIFRIAEHGDEHFIELNVPAASVIEGAYRLFVRGPEIGEKCVERRINGFIDRRPVRAAVER